MAVKDGSDESLMADYQAGDVRAFESLLRRYRKPLFNFVLRFVGSREKAEDLVQDTFLKVAKNADAYRKRAKFSTWVYTIARNLCIDELRRAKHRHTTSLDAPAGTDPEADGSLGDLVPGGGPAPDRAAASSRVAPMLVEALQSLPGEQREVFVLREYSGVPFREIARITDTAENTVKSRMRYALEGLRKFLEGRGITSADALVEDASVRGVLGT